MKSEYLEYNLEQLLEEKSFIAWVLREENKKGWEEFIAANPGFALKAKKAREIIMLLRDTSNVLDEESVLEMWQNINRFEKFHQQKTKKHHFRKIFTRAATILAIVSLAAAAYFYLNDKGKDYQFETARWHNSANEARLMLSNGEEVLLKKDNSSIDLTQNNQLVINNDSVIDLSTRKSDNIKMNEVIIPFGKRSELLLADGTKVWLNAGSRLAFPSRFSQKTREVYLEGEACFKVAKNENQPFIVNAGDLDIKVLGTWFNVSAYASDKNIETVLLEGSVAVAKPKTFGLAKNEVILKPNQRASYNKQNTDINLYNEPEAELFIAWTEGWLQFSKESLHSVFTRLERYYDVEIILPDNFPPNELISGKLDLKDSLKEVIIALADVAKIEYRIANKKVYIDKNVKQMPRK